mgnify:CR=1 FL=1
MIQVTVGTNTKREKKIVEPHTTLREVLEESEVNYEVAQVHLDGCTLEPGDLDRSFSEIGITDTCYLIAVVKAENA